MCGRFVLTIRAHILAEILGVYGPLPVIVPRFNIAPTQQVLVARRARDSSSPGFTMMRWGLIPFWTKDPTASPAPINARVDSADTKPAFREPFRQRRCLIPADGFYEWRTLSDGTRQPMCIRPAELVAGQASDGPLFAFAGLWDRWRPRDGEGSGSGGEPIETCTILTTDPNSLLGTVHDRMPVILEREHWSAWLDPSFDDAAALKAMCSAYPAEKMTMHAVRRVVNSPRHDGPDCMTPVPEDDSPRTLFG